MPMTGIIIAIVAVAIISYLKYRSYEREKEQEMETEENMEAENDRETEIMESHKGTRDLLTDIFKKWGCQYELNDDGTRIYVLFQGGTFYVDADNEHVMVDIYYPAWMDCDLSDIDEFSRLRKTVNDVNIMSGGDTIVYTIDEDEEKVMLHSRRRIILLSQMPDVESYLRAMLVGFFETRQKFHEELTRQRAEENVKQTR
mgnify:CR=1 FL=1